VSVRVQTAPFDAQAEADALREGDLDVGAVVTFVGTVRDVNGGDDGRATGRPEPAPPSGGGGRRPLRGDVSSLTLEHYPGMTEKALEAIVDEARLRFDVRRILVIHRVGTLAPGDPIVLVAVTGAHRGAAFDACRFVMDYLKTRAPFWKKERTPEGDRWVEARASDDEAAGLWNAPRERPELA
jgi:molybdopterin synthase catalytic subunit